MGVGPCPSTALQEEGSSPAGLGGTAVSWWVSSLGRLSLVWSSDGPSSARAWVGQATGGSVGVPCVCTREWRCVYMVCMWVCGGGRV